MSQRIGIYGGMFDPVHHGHVQVARHAIETLKLDKLLMVPCHNPNHREKASATAEQRVQMLNLATALAAKIEVSDFELQQEAKSYTLKTVEHFRLQCPESELIFVMGVDSLINLEQWYEWKSLFSACHLFVVSRPGYEIPPVSAEFKSVASLVGSVDELFSSETGNVLISDSLNYEHASSTLRNELREESSPQILSDYVDSNVAEFISTENLYFKSH